VRAGFVLEIAVAGTTGLLLLIFRNKIALIFTDDKKVAREAAEAAIFVASYQVFDGLQNVGAACLRAFGRQNVGSIIHFVGYYVVGLPLGAYLGLGAPRWGLSGLWAGAAIALACTSAAELLFAFTIRWESEVERVQAREADELSDSDSSEDDGFAH
jgi:MATE family multidrug resistance protein